MEDYYKNYGKILQSDFVSLPYKNHHLNTDNNIVPCSLGRAAYHQQNRLFYFTDQNEGLLKSVDDELDLEVKEDINPDDNTLVVSTVSGRNPGKLLEKPISICINSQGDIFVGDNGNYCANINTSRIFVFDSNLTIVSVIKHDEIVSPSGMDIENTNRTQFKLYVTDSKSNSLTILKVIYNSSIRRYSSEFDNQIKIVSPTTVRLTKDYIAVLSGQNLVGENRSGLDSIVLFNKQTLEHVRKIELVDRFGLTGLFVDKQMRLYTVAYKLSSKNCVNIKQQNGHNLIENSIDEPIQLNREISKDMYLIVVDLNGEILQETNLGIESLTDFLLFEDINKIFIMDQFKQPTMHLVKFTKNQD